MGFRAQILCAAWAVPWLAGSPSWAATADLVVTDARIYTADAKRSLAEALAVKDGKIVFVGSSSDAASWVGPQTRVEHLAGKLILPGLIDSHIHPLDIVDLDVCNLNSRPQKTLSDLSAFVHDCAVRYRLPPGKWLMVYQWNYTAGNQPDDGVLHTFRAALDKADSAQSRSSCSATTDTTEHSTARRSRWPRTRPARRLGFSKATLAGDFRANRVKLIGVDDKGRAERRRE